MLAEHGVTPAPGGAAIAPWEPAARTGEQDGRYRQVFENSSDALFIVDVGITGGLRFNSVNAAAEEAFGLPAAMLKGLSLDHVVGDWLGPEFGRALAENIASYRDCVATGMPQQYEGPLDLLPERRGGRRRFRVQLLPLVGDEGIERIIGIAHDITLREQYESELRERARLEQQISALAAMVPGFLFTLRATPEGRTSFPFASAGVEALFGLRPEEIRDDAAVLHARFHPDDRAQASQLMAQATFGQAPSGHELRVVHPDKGERWVEVRSMPRPRPDGATEWHGLMIDVTARKRAESDCHRREREFHTLAEHSPDIIIRYDRAGRRLYVSPSYALATGMPVARVLGRTLAEVSPLPEAHLDAVRAMLTQVAETGVAGEIKLAWRRGGEGDPAAYDIRAVPEFDERGAVASVLTVARDISALKETERQLLESRAQLQELFARREEVREEERKRIARDLHEELGQLLTALRMRISTLPLEFGGVLPGLREASDGMIQLVDRAIHAMRDVITSLRPASLDAGIGVALEWLACEFARHVGIDCRVALSEQRPDFSEAQATAVFRIVQEALTNVARHAGARRVDIRLDRDGGDWRLEVRDDGRGCAARASRGRSFGILDMSERALMLGGGLEIAVLPEGGTVVRVRFPAR